MPDREAANPERREVPEPGARDPAPGGAAQVQRVLALQRSAGNAAVSRALLNRQEDGSATATAAPEARAQELRSGPAGPLQQRVPISPDMLEALEPQSRRPDIRPGDTGSVTYERHAGTPFVRGAGDTSDIDPNDVDQGSLGDCYLLASLMAIARANPDVIRNMIRGPVGQTPEGANIYEVTLQIEREFLFFFTQRQPTVIRVDDTFPTGAGGAPEYAQYGDRSATDGPELWVMLIEKAFAAHKGGYEAINSGTASATLPILTGSNATYSSCDSKTEDQILSDINSAISSHKPVTSPSRATFSAEDLAHATAQGINPIAGHSYNPAAVDMSARTIDVMNPHGGNHLLRLPIADFKRYFAGYVILDNSLR